MREAEPARALLVDDDPYVREVVGACLRDAGYQVADASDGEAAVQLAATRPDVIVMDVFMPPGISGIEATRRIVDRDPSARVVMFSVHDSPDIVSASVAAGATSYVTKNAGLKTLVDAILRTIDGQAVLIPAPNPSTTSRRVATLSARQREILAMAAAGLSTAQMAQRLAVSPRTVENHLHRIYATLGVRSRVELLRAAAQSQVLDSYGTEGNDVDPRGWESLTQREREVVAMISEGHTNPEVAARLYITKDTVAYHLKSVYRKLGISGRGQLAGLLDRPAADE